MYIWGSGKPLREFIYSQDVADLTIWCLFNYNESETIILSNGIELSITDVVNTLANVMGFKGEIIYQSDKPDGQLRKPTDISKIKKYLPDFKFTPLREGLTKTVKWFYDNYPNIRL
jgi:GDP-L-fucose synthase